jgi:hypothetical protein
MVKPGVTKETLRFNAGSMLSISRASLAATMWFWKLTNSNDISETNY